MISIEQFLVATLEQGVLARDGIDVWQRDLTVADAEGRFAFAGRKFAGVGRGRDKVGFLNGTCDLIDENGYCK